MKIKKLAKLALTTLVIQLTVLPSSANAEPLTKKEAQKILIEQLNSDKNFKNPIEREFALCFFDPEKMIEEAFGPEKILDSEILLERIKEITNRKAQHLEKNKKETEFLMMRCLVNSDFFAEAAKKAQQEDKDATERSKEASTISLNDLKLDLGKLTGKRIKTEGNGIYMMDRLFIRNDLMDMSPVWVDITGLDRGSRKYIIDRCSDITKGGCQITIEGKVGSVSYQKGIIAEKIGSLNNY